MKKIISILSVMAFLFYGYALGEQDKEVIEICKEAAEKESVSSEMVDEYIDKCMKYIMEDEIKENIELKQGI